MASKTHGEFIDSFMEYVGEESVDSRKEISPVKYGSGRWVCLCPEPQTFLSKMDAVADDRAACCQKFEELLKTFDRLKLDHGPVNEEGEPVDVWFNTTRDGINLRPGIDDKSGTPKAIQMGDAAVHGLMVGQTGSGKSVLLNDMIFNLLAEYPSWELDLYLADFKRVEFSRYMNVHKTPHLRACAATGEIRYVLSLIQYLVDCMNAREALFARLGVDKIASFREKYSNVVLPRILLIVDEFQQMFLEASTRESEQIRQMLTAIVKKGRATGLHLLFASQETSGTLSRSDLSNFRLRFALNCNVNVSLEVLGNRAAAQINRGTVLVNMSDGSEESNKKYSVPLIETEEEDDGSKEVHSYFYDYLEWMETLAGQYHYQKSQKFYKEEQQEDWSKLEKLLSHPAIRQEREKHLQEGKYFDVLTLGHYVTFTNRVHDVQTLFLEKGRNKNILAISPRPEDLAYLLKLLACNFKTSPRGEATGMDYKHEIYSFQPVVSGIISLDKELGQSRSRCHTSQEELNGLQMEFARKRMMYRLFREAKTPLDFALGNIRENLELAQRQASATQIREMREKLNRQAEEKFGGISMDEVPEVCKQILTQTPQSPNSMEWTLAKNLMEFERYQKEPEKVFPPTIYWICGVDSVERIPDWLLQMMKDGTEYNMLFVMMASSEFDQMSQVSKLCDYLFLGGTNSRIYERLGVNFTRRSADSIALDLYIRSMEEERSFKKYRCHFDKVQAPSLDFDSLLGEEDE